MSRQESLAGFRKAKLLAAVQGFQGFDPLFQEREDHMNCKHSWNPGGAFLLPNVCVCVATSSVPTAPTYRTSTGVFHARPGHM